MRKHGDVESGARKIAMPIKRIFAAAFISTCTPYTQAQIVETPSRFSEYVITATRSETAVMDLPMAVDRIDADAIQNGQQKINLSESLIRVPGIVAHNRQNYAQDLQISIRGFGARSTFGVRGVRIYVDDIPATMPDGQGQLSHIDLGSADHIEVLRGPFSALYGNSSGGVIAVFSETPRAGSYIGIDGGVGEDGTQREAIKLSGAQAGYDYLFDLANFRSDGYREHSAVRRTNLNSKLNVALDDQSSLKIIVNALDMPQAQDPLGLTRAQFESDAEQAGTNAELFDTRKSVRQQQLGLSYRRTISADDDFSVMLYRGRRSTVQYQSIPTAAQIAPTSAGGVIDLARDYWGSDLHWTHRGDALFGAPWQLTGGISFDTLDEDRRGYRNFVGSAVGIKGDLRRDESNRVYNIDNYVQWQWQPLARLSINAGIRNSTVRIKSNDHYIGAGNGDDSGTVMYRATTPVLGVSWHLSDATNLYASYGTGFETPTVNELAYRSTSGNSTGLNLALDPSRSEHYELGAKMRLDSIGNMNFALFNITTHDELAVAANSAGRSVYQNAGKTQRDGAELSFENRWSNGIGAAFAYTWLRAQYADDFNSCAGSPCATPQIIDAGNYIPGVPSNVVFGELSWRHARSGFDTALELRRESKLYVNDANSDATASYTVTNWRAGFVQTLGQWKFNQFVRIDNLTDRDYIGSVIVNESNARFFEPAPGRSLFIGVGVSGRL